MKFARCSNLNLTRRVDSLRVTFMICALSNKVGAIASAFLPRFVMCYIVSQVPEHRDGLSQEKAIINAM